MSNRYANASPKKGEGVFDSANSDYQFAMQMSELLARWCHELSCEEVEVLEKETKLALFQFDQSVQRRLAA